MKKLYPLFLFLSCAFLATTTAQTTFSGGIFDNTTWDATGSPYIIDDEVVIFPGGSLTIEAGVSVLVNPDKGIELRNGSLYVNGTAEDPVIFTVNDSNPGDNNMWRGIESTSDQFTPVDIELDHCVIEYANTGIIYGGGGNYRYVDNAIFRYNDRAIYDGSEGYEWITISNSTFHNNGICTEGRVSYVNCDAYDNEMVATNLNSFSNGSEGGRMTNSTFSNNGICITPINSQIWVSAYLENSVFTDNETVAIAPRVEASSCIFEGSTTMAIQRSTGTIENCTFVDNEIGIRTSLNPYEDTIRNNSFFDNNVALQIDGPGAYIRGNAICNSDTYGALLNTPNNVDLSQNCWCTTEESQVADLIFDAVEDVSLGLAGFTPIIINCVEGLVYPGDANSDGQANARDVLEIGLHYGATGPQRNSTDDWQGLEADDWGITNLSGLDLKHIDTDGNGIIDENDLAPISDNYLLSHPNPSALPPIVSDNPAYSLQLESPDEVFPEQPLSLGVLLGDAALPVPACYGLAFALEGNTDFFESGSFQLSFENSWLGTADELLVFYRERPELLRVEVAIVRKDGQPRSGSGRVANLGFVMSEDLIISIEGLGTEVTEYLSLRLTDLEGINHEGLRYELTNEPVELTIVSTDNISLPSNLRVFPNPTSNGLNLPADAPDLARVTLLDLRGQQLRQWSGQLRQFELGDLPSGSYQLQLFTTDGQRWVQRIVVME